MIINLVLSTRGDFIMILKSEVMIKLEIELKLHINKKLYERNLITEEMFIKAKQKFLES